MYAYVYTQVLSCVTGRAASFQRRIERWRRFYLRESTLNSRNVAETGHAGHLVYAESTETPLYRERSGHILLRVQTVVRTIVSFTILEPDRSVYNKVRGE